MPRVPALLPLCAVVLALSGCPKDGGSRAGDGGDADAAADGSGDGSLPDAADHADGHDGTDGADVPYGWVSPRCGGSAIVASCADCPSQPYTCNACELSANCVADCSSDCGGDVACPDTGQCVEPGVACTTDIFCGCAPPLKACDQGTSVACVGNCTAECPGLTNDFYGSCSDFPPGLGGCPDGDGAEYYCQATAPDGTGICTTSCESCGSFYCLNGSCAGEFCRPGLVPDSPFYTCGRAFCCTDGFLCPATAGCVASCGDCPGAAAGACGEHGTCVADCDACFTGPATGRDVRVCDGECVDVLTDQRHCGACAQPCVGGLERAQCSAGHCCLGSFASPPPWSWCDLCSCCLGLGMPCNAANCTFGCVSS